VYYKIMKTNTQKLNNIIGQIEGVKKMIDRKDDCIPVLTQLKAVRSAVTGVMDSIVEEQLDTCMKSMDKKDRNLFDQMKTYVRSN